MIYSSQISDYSSGYEYSENSDSNHRNEIVSYRLKNPGFLKRVTSTIYRKSSKEDIEKIRAKILKFKRSYKAKHHNLSVNLEYILKDHDRNLKRMRKRLKKQPTTLKFKKWINESNKKFHKTRHLSLSSKKQVSKLVRKFHKEYPLNLHKYQSENSYSKDLTSEIT